MRRAVIILALTSAAALANDPRLMRGGVGVDVWVPFSDGTARNWARGNAGVHSGYPTADINGGVWHKKSFEETYGWPRETAPSQTGISGTMWANMHTVVTNNGYVYTNNGGALYLTIDMSWHSQTNAGFVDGLGTVTTYGGSNLYCSTTGFASVPSGARMMVYNPGNTSRTEYANGGSADAVAWPIDQTSMVTRTWTTYRLWTTNYAGCQWGYFSAPVATQQCYTFYHFLTGAVVSCVSLDEWHRYGFVVDLIVTNISLYLNGSGVGTYPLEADGADSMPSVIPPDARFRIRPRTFLQFDYMDVDEPKWWGRALPESEIYDLRNERREP